MSKSAIHIRLLICIAMVTCHAMLAAQVPPVYKMTDIDIYEGGYKLKTPFTGGFNNPVMSTADLDNDGINDLVIYERVERRFYAFKNGGTSGQVDYTYAPHLADGLPLCYEFALFYDYNCDNIPDLFTYSPIGGAGIAVYRGRYQGNQLQMDFIVNRIYDTTGLQVYVDALKLPAFADVNGDGDLDILVFEQFDGTIGYYENRSQERGYGCDSLLFAKQTNCWGHICECSPVNNTITLHFSDPYCYFNLLKPPAQQEDTLTNPGTRHVGSTLTALDIDKDGRQEVLVGDASYNNLIMLFNGGKTTDSLVAQDTLYPFYDYPINVPVFPAAYYLDADNDGLNDLLIAPYNLNNCFLNTLLDTSVNVNNIWFYKNIGSSSRDSFQFVTSSFLVGDMIDIGETSHPVFFDYNADGKLDIIAGTCFYYDDTLQLITGLTLYENTGSSTQPAFTLRSRDYASLDTLRLYGLHPAVDDVDKDGDTDLVTGYFDGKFYFFRNTASAGNPASFNLASNSFGGLAPGVHTAPFIIDFDNDGLPDLLTGEPQGRVFHYHNKGPVANPVFDTVSLFWGKVVVRVNSIFGYSIPVLGDIDGDTKFELLVGSESGGVFYYDKLEDAGPSDAFTLADSAFFGDGWGSRSTVSVADINADGYLDFVLGNQRGGICFYSLKNPIGMHEQPSLETALKLAPNPATARLNISWNTSLPYNEGILTISDLSGRVLQQTIIADSLPDATVDISELTPGLYIVALRSGHILLRKKLVVVR